MAAPLRLRFTVRRKAVELLAPAGPTPRELKRLSDIDDQDGLRFHIPNLFFYPANAPLNGSDPAAVVRDAVARALVHYYPFAGRLRELEGRKLAVDCTGEGVLFTEADADVPLEHFGKAPLPPFVGLEELLFDVPGSSQVLGTPLLLFQVTRLSCGGFILAVRMMHAMSDAQGLVQFLTAVAELAQGAAVPSVRPVWDREVLEARNPPRPGFAHREYEDVQDTKGAILPSFGTKELPGVGCHIPMEDCSFFFGAKELAAVRSHLSPDLRKRATTFEVLVGCLWKCRTIALAPDADEEMRMMCIVSARRANGASIPRGYYGNAFAFPVAVSAAGKLCAMPLSYAVQLVHEAKGGVDMEYMRSVADLMVLRGRPHVAAVRAYLASDVTKAGFDKLDFGWGKPLYAGPAKADGLGSFLVVSMNAKGEKGIVIPVCLPRPAMAKLVQEMSKLMCPAGDVTATIKSAL